MIGGIGCVILCYAFYTDYMDNLNFSVRMYEADKARYSTTGRVTSKDFCGKVRYRIMKNGSENKFGKGKETWQH